MRDGETQMLALVNTPNGKAPVELRQVPEPAPGVHEALVAVQAFALNRGELRSFRNNEEGWIPGQDISGIVLRQAADGSGPPVGTRIVALMDEFRLGRTRLHRARVRTINLMEKLREKA
jgi:NADPH2:quinone reductase